MAIKYKKVLAALIAGGTLLSSVPASSQEDAAKKTAASVCASCHGIDGNSVQSTVPNLAGLQDRYLVKQMKDYVAGTRKNDTATPCGPSLNPADIEGLATYFSDQKPAPGKAGDATLVAEGKKIYEQGNSITGVDDCQECHKPRGVGSGLYPRMAGQSAAYTLKQMLTFKTRARSNDKNEVMQDVAENMTEQEMRAVAEYLMGL
jgi:cytochrome c553